MYLYAKLVFSKSSKLFLQGQEVIPAELEEIILGAHEFINDVAVIGIYDEQKATEYPAAYVSLKINIISPFVKLKLKKDIKDFVAQRVADHKKLRGGVYFIDKIPRGPSGKIKRKLLKERIKT